MELLLMVVGSLVFGILATAWLVSALMITFLFIVEPPWSDGALPITFWLLLSAFVVVPPMVCVLALRWYLYRNRTEVPG